MQQYIGSKIKELRLIAEMSQEELGRRVGVQRAAIQKYEKGTVGNIPITTIEQIAKVFDVSPTYIVGWNDSNCDPLAAEVRVLQGVKRFYGEDAVALLDCYSTLNAHGKRRVRTYTNDMTLIYEEDK